MNERMYETRKGSGRTLWLAGIALGLLVTAVQGFQDRPSTSNRIEDVAPPVTTALADQDDAGGTPKIVAVEPVHDFGVTWAGTDLEHTFTIKNEGTVVLLINQVRPACGCTKTGAHPGKLAPGESGEFSFKISTKKLRNKYSKSIRVLTNDPTNGTLNLVLKGVCRRYVDIQPPTAYFTRVSEDDTSEKVLTLTNNTDTPMVLTLPPVKANAKFEYSLTETDPGKKYELKIRPRAGQGAGNVRDILALQSNLPKAKKIEVTVTARIVPRLEALPSPFYITTSPRAASRQIYFTNSGKTDVHVLDVKVDGDQDKLKPTFKELKPGKQYLVRLSIPANYKLPAKGLTLSIITDDEKQSETKVAIKMRKKPKPRRKPQEDMLGKPVPKFSMSTTKGKSLATADLTGNDTVTVLNFFAVNCGYCKKSMPRVETVRSEFEGKKVRFINISQTMRKPYTEEEVIAKCDGLGWKGEIVLDPKNSMGPLFNARSYPSLFVVSRDGTVGQVVVGNKANLETSLRDSINAMLKPGYKAPKPLPASAKASTKPRKRPQEKMIGKPAPQFALTTMAGRSLATKDLKGQVTVLDFFAVNCGFCSKQMPRLDSLRSEYAAKGVRFVAVSQTMRNKRYTDQQVLDKCKKSGWSGEIAADPDNKVGPLFNAGSYPSMFVVGKDGKIAAAIVGNKAGLEKLVKTALDKALKGSTKQAKAGPVPRPGDTGALSNKQ